ncbi:hypothetical protein [Kutzneria sp. CA-103260]|uniref:hypothetical protein n=1 Tax=Kutzneria sp. CA-103260 TaxID=2802641 RepID=UPI001BA8C0C6|nr:hypothetical protein [Kutzneria sp. CA-103260]QUQ70236.1 hypothetical protein JJ691_80110 [Kutzneria sp. CA-103260]
MEKAEQVGADLGLIGAITAPFAGVQSEYAGISGGQITVNHDTVLQAGKIIHDQWQQLLEITLPKLQDMQLGVLGQDLVSQAATGEWAKILVSNDDSYSKRIAQYIDGLGKLADQLKTAAQQYGFTEEEITAAFGDK